MEEGVPGWAAQVVGDMLRTLADTHVLIDADVRDNLAATAQGRGAIDKSQTLPDLVVKLQCIDLADVILWLVL